MKQVCFFHYIQITEKQNPVSYKNPKVTSFQQPREVEYSLGNIGLLKIEDFPRDIWEQHKHSPQ